MRPQFRRTQLEIRMRSRLVPEHLILQLIGFGVIVNDETLEVLRTLIHDLAEAVKIRKHSRILLIDFAPIADIVFPQNKHIVNIRAQRRWNSHRVLHRDDKHGVYVPSIHEQILHIPIIDPTVIEETVIQNQEVARIYRSGSALSDIFGDLFGQKFLAFQHIGDNQG